MVKSNDIILRKHIETVLKIKDILKIREIIHNLMDISKE